MDLNIFATNRITSTTTTENYNLNLDAIRLRQAVSRAWPGWSPNLLEKTEIYECDEHRHEIEQYRVENLNSEQYKIFRHMMDNSNDIIVVQAGPGCGKSFVLKSIAYNQTHDIETVIYKSDLLAAFKYNSRRFTVAKFIMQTLQLPYYHYVSMDLLLTSRMDSFEFILALISMLKKAQLPDIRDSIVFFDEYTVMSKPFLLMILMLLEHHRIGAIICGDRNQLQTIHNSKHTILSSFSLAQAFARKTFELSKNERCSNSSYNQIIEYFSEFSSNQHLDTYAYAMVSAFFLRQLIEPPKYHHIHLAATHQELSDLAHMLVCNNAYDCEFYFIDQTKVRDRGTEKTIMLAPTPVLAYNTRIVENKPPKVDKFLPYLPLVVGGRYYYERHSDQSLVTLVSIDRDEQVVIVRNDRGEEFPVKRTSKFDGVLFDQHREFLMNKSPGKIFNYPLYPANFMSMHKCQGCTITDDLDLLLNNTNYQGLYVALSRVTNPKQIKRVTIPNQISHIISTIINFPQYCTFVETEDDDDVTAAAATDDDNDADDDDNDKFKPKYTAATSAVGANNNENVKQQTKSSRKKVETFTTTTKTKIFSEKLKNVPTIDEVRNAMVNYIHYEISNNQSDLSRFSLLASEFLLSNDIDIRQSIRNRIIELVNSKVYRKQILVRRCPTETVENPHSLLTMNKIIKYRKIILALSRLEEHDRNVWLHEFMLNNLDLIQLLPENFKRNSQKMESFMHRDLNVLTIFAGLNNSYSLNISSMEYIKSIAKTNIIVDVEEQARNLKYTIDILDKNVFMLTTEFCAKVYKKYELLELCTVDWLMDELNLLLNDVYDCKTSEPEKGYGCGIVVGGGGGGGVRYNNTSSTTTTTTTTTLGMTKKSTDKTMALLKQSMIRKRKNEPTLPPPPPRNFDERRVINNSINSIEKIENANDNHDDETMSTGNKDNRLLNLIRSTKRKKVY